MQRKMGVQKEKNSCVLETKNRSKYVSIEMQFDLLLLRFFERFPLDIRIVNTSITDFNISKFTLLVKIDYLRINTYFFCTRRY